MPGFLVHEGARVTCLHGGQVQPHGTPNRRVRVSGQAVLTQALPYDVQNCPFVPPGGNGPCVSAQWQVVATHVCAGGAPVLLSDSQAVCAPTGATVKVVRTQTRVQGV